MGARGPVGKRSDQKLGHHAAAEAADVDRAAAGERPEIPKADPGWHPIARRWFESLPKSGQSAFYEASDWAEAELVAEVMSRNLKADKFSAMLFQSVLSAASRLMTTEGDRRRLRLELERGAQNDADEDAADAAVINAVARFSR